MQRPLVVAVAAVVVVVGAIVVIAAGSAADDANAFAADDVAAAAAADDDGVAAVDDDGFVDGAANVVAVAYDVVDANRHHQNLFDLEQNDRHRRRRHVFDSYDCFVDDIVVCG